MFKLLTLISLLCFFSVPVYALEKEPWNMDGQFPSAIVVDTGLSALRKSPSVTSNCLRRLRIGRKVFIISSTKNKAGIKYYFIAVTRRTRGYIDASALVKPLQLGDDARLMRLVENAESVDKIILAQILVKNFPKSHFCPNALLAEGQTAEEIAKELSRRTSKRSIHQLDPTIDLERYFLNYSGLDKYNRLGINFQLDPTEKVYHYDGTAYKKILTHYPKSHTALIASERLQPLLAKGEE